MTFREFLQFMEARPLPKLAGLPTPQQAPQLQLAPGTATSPKPPARSDVNAPPEVRLARGWSDEDMIKDILAKMVGPVKNAPGGQGGLADTSAKIDAYLTNERTGQTVSLQIKARQSGNDVIFEAVKDIEVFLRAAGDINQLSSSRAVQLPGAGRDMITQAEAYAVMDSARTFINIVSAQSAKEIGVEMVKAWDLANRPADHYSSYGRAHMQHGDRYNMKLVCFIKPSAIARLPGFYPVAIPK